MSSYNGKCHCGQTEWTAELTGDQQGHILWYVCCNNFNCHFRATIDRIESDVYPAIAIPARCFPAHHTVSILPDVPYILSQPKIALNQIIPIDALSITKGKDLGKYTYKGDSGKGVHCVSFI
jgi:hypothetical protein